jgi:glutamine---fructose-6-phosphate transaminase (isomerizing)
MIGARAAARSHRSRRRRDVSRLRRDRAGAVHRPGHLSRRRRLGGPDARRRGIRDVAGVTVERPVVKTIASSLLVDKGNHRTSWPRRSTSSRRSSAIRWRTTSTFGRAGGAALRRCRSISPTLDRISITACGTAFYAGLVAKYWFERFARLPVDIDIASEFRYREPPLSGTACPSSSRSRARPPTRWPRCAMPRAGARRSPIVNVRESTIAREADVVLPTLAGPEIGVASTKAFTCQLAVLACARGCRRQGARALSAEERTSRSSSAR